MKTDKKEMGFSLGALPAWFAGALITGGGVGFVVIGHYLAQSYYRAYLAEFQVDSHAFPLEGDETRSWGANAYLHIGEMLGSWWNNHPLRHLAVVVYLIFMLTWLYFLLHRKRDSSAATKQDKIFKALIFSVSGAISITWSIPISGVFIGMPGTFGKSAGIEQAELDRAVFEKGCALGKQLCIVLKKDGKQIGCGFRIVQSKDRIALFQNGRTGEFELAGVNTYTVSREAASTCQLTSLEASGKS